MFNPFSPASPIPAFLPLYLCRLCLCRLKPFEPCDPAPVPFFFCFLGFCAGLTLGDVLVVTLVLLVLLWEVQAVVVVVVVVEFLATGRELFWAGAGVTVTAGGTLGLKTRNGTSGPFDLSVAPGVRKLSCHGMGVRMPALRGWISPA